MDLKSVMKKIHQVNVKGQNIKLEWKEMKGTTGMTRRKG